MFPVLLGVCLLRGVWIDTEKLPASFPILPGGVSGLGFAHTPALLICPLDVALLVCVMTAHGGSGFTSPVASPLPRTGN